jgi:hypothetical protein
MMIAPAVFSDKAASGGSRSPAILQYNLSDSADPLFVRRYRLMVHADHTIIQTQLPGRYRIRTQCQYRVIDASLTQQAAYGFILSPENDHSRFDFVQHMRNGTG